MAKANKEIRRTSSGRPTSNKKIQKRLSSKTIKAEGLNEDMYGALCEGRIPIQSMNFKDAYSFIMASSTDPDIVLKKDF